MNKTETLNEFRTLFKSELKELRGDSIAKSELWFNYIDSLLKNEFLTDKQINEWSNPFRREQK